MHFQIEQFKLRPFEPHDAPALQAYLNHPKLSGRRYVPHGFPEEVPLSLHQVEAIIEEWGEGESEAHLAIELSGKGELIGQAEFVWNWDPHAPRVAIVLARPYQRQGYGTLALNLVLEYLFDHTPAHNVFSWIADWNQSGRSFAKVMGFQESGRSRREGFREGAYFDYILVDILRPEYRSRGGLRYGAGR